MCMCVVAFFSFSFILSLSLWLSYLTPRFFFFFWLISSRCFLCCVGYILWLVLCIFCSRRLLRESSLKMRVQQTLLCECSDCVNIRPFWTENTETLCVTMLLIHVRLMLLLLLLPLLLLLSNKVQCQRHRWFAFFISLFMAYRFKYMHSSFIDQKH